MDPFDCGGMIAMYLGNINNLCYTLYKQRVACVSSSSATLAFHHVTTTMTTHQDCSGVLPHETIPTCVILPSERDTFLSQAHCDAGELHGARSDITAPGYVATRTSTPSQPTSTQLPRAWLRHRPLRPQPPRPAHPAAPPPLPHPLPRQFLAALQVPQAPPLPTDTIAQGTAWRQGQHPACGWPAPAVAAHASDRPALARPVRWALGRTDTDHGGQTAIRLGLVRVCVI